MNVYGCDRCDLISLIKARLFTPAPLELDSRQFISPAGLRLHRSSSALFLLGLDLQLPLFIVFTQSAVFLLLLHLLLTLLWHFLRQFCLICISQRRDSILKRFIIADGGNWMLADPPATPPPSSPPFPVSLQSTSSSAQAGLLPQGVRMLRSPAAAPQASSDAFTFPQTACPLEQNFTVEEVNTPKVRSSLFMAKQTEVPKVFTFCTWEKVLVGQRESTRFSSLPK